MSDKNARFVRNGLFVGCALVALFSALVNYALLPDLDTIERRSYLEGRIYQNLPAFSMGNYIEGVYQDEFEQFAADSIPCRDDVMLFNAGLQRLGISSANALFGYEAFPTFFGSEYLEYPQEAAIVEYPSSKRVVTPELLGDCLDSVTAAVERYPASRWRFALIDRSRNSAANPASALVAQHADYEYYRREFLEKLPATCPYIDLEVVDSGEYFANYFHTDHHWQITGALQAYSQIMASLERKAPATTDVACMFAGPFYGSEARSGLSTEHADALYDLRKPKASFKVTVDGEKVDVSWLNRGFTATDGGYVPEDRFANVYAEWFHADAGEIRITNKKGKGTLLIVGDSFTNAIDYLFAYSYRDVYIIDPRHYDGTLRTFFKKHKPDDVLLLMASNTLVNPSTTKFLA